jgi:L-alanine-DL-glutamate epimerase-like enolase superfamily enzyme
LKGFGWRIKNPIFSSTPSLSKGKITEFRKIAALAEAYKVKMAPHSAYFGPGLLATAHLIAGSPPAVALEHFYFQLEASVFKEALRFEKGEFILPRGPGLGLEIDSAVLKEYAANPK